MTKADLIRALSKKSGLAKKQVAELLHQILALAIREIKHGFLLPGIGRLGLAHRKARRGRNPRSGEPIRIPARRVVKFRVAKALEEAVFGKK